MMTVLVAFGSILTYLALGLPVARTGFQRIRPYTEPLNCTTELSCSSRHNGKHYNSCYRRWGLVDSKGEAAAIAILWGILWPISGLILVVVSAIQTGIRELPEEREAKISRMEREAGI
jgi:hypothetical protein